MSPFTKVSLFVGLLIGVVQSSSAAVETYAIDPVHSSVGFTIRHFVSRVPGSFSKVTGTITIDRQNLEKSSVDVVVDVNSVSTHNDKRDNHLKSPDFFDAAKYGTATFKSKAWKKTGTDTFDITGDLTLHGVTKEVVLNMTLLGFGPGPQGGQLVGWEGTTKLKKSDFGVLGPAMLSKAVGDDVTINLAVEAGQKT